jgi:hypothetical protein
MHTHPPGHRIFWWGLAPLALAAVLVAWACVGCANNPVSLAQTAPQKAYALYGEFVIFEEQAAALKQSGALSGDTLVQVQRADNIAKPTADHLLKTVLAYETFAHTPAGDPRAAAAGLELSNALNDAARDVGELVTLVRGVHAP